MALPSILIFSLVLVSISWQCLNLVKNYIAARKIGLPVLVTPISATNPLWVFGNRYLIPILECLPFGLGNFVHHSGVTWVFPDRYRNHERHGLVFTIATPGEIEVVFADPATANDVLARRKDFDKSEIAIMLDIFGPNLLTTGNEAWPKYRRLTVPPFSESCSSFVWRQSLLQSSEMLKAWVSQGRSGVDAVADTMRTTLHVLVSVGLGKTHGFQEETTKRSGAHKMSYMEALQMLLAKIQLAAVLNLLHLPTFILPPKLKEVACAIGEFRAHMEEMMEEKSRLAEGGEEARKNNLLSVLLRSRDGSGRDGLSNEEILGNLFTYNIAGHDTISNTLTYCLYLISVHPEIQEWIREEITYVLGSDSNVEDWKYEDAFPRLKRCLALMNETLRLYSPSIGTIRSTGHTPQMINVAGKQHTIPAKALLLINFVALGSLPRFWGNDSLTWRPDRWIRQAPGSSGLDGEHIYQPYPGTFIPFASGPRVCPGAKFAQVEFVALIARVFRKHRCAPILLDGETMIEAKKRIHEVVEDSNIGLTLKMKTAERVRLHWEDIL